jgi:hypothetical protein
MAAPETTDHPVVAATPARQGRWGRHVFWVLVISTLLAALALFAAWMFRADDLASTEVKSNGAVSAQHSFDAPEPPPATR